MRNHRLILTPLHALGAGLVAGVVGSGVQSLFFALTKKVAPAPVTSAFHPPEPTQLHETETETVARRIVHGLAVRPIAPAWKRVGGRLVHFAFGAGWGALYGLALGAYPRRHGPLAIVGFSTLVWALSDNVLLPVFQIAGKPTAYPVKNHAYAWAAHVAYGAAVGSAFEVMRAVPRR